MHTNGSQPHRGCRLSKPSFGLLPCSDANVSRETFVRLLILARIASASPSRGLCLAPAAAVVVSQPAAASVQPTARPMAKRHRIRKRARAFAARGARSRKLASLRPGAMRKKGFRRVRSPGAKLPNSMVSCHGEPLPPSSRPRRGLGGRHPAEKSSGEGATSGPVAVGLTAGLRKERTTWPFPPVKTQKARRRGYATRFRG